MFLAIVYMCGAINNGPLSCSSASIPVLFPTEAACEAAAIDFNFKAFEALSPDHQEGLKDLGQRCISIGAET